MAREFAFFSNQQYFNEHPYIVPAIRDFNPVVENYLKSIGYEQVNNQSEFGCTLRTDYNTTISYLYRQNTSNIPRMYISTFVNNRDEDHTETLNLAETHRQGIINTLNNSELLNATLDDFSFKMETLNQLEWRDANGPATGWLGLYDLLVNTTPILPSSFRKAFTEHLVNNHSWEPVNSDLTIFERDV